MPTHPTCLHMWISSARLLHELCPSRFRHQSDSSIRGPLAATLLLNSAIGQRLGKCVDRHWFLFIDRAPLKISLVQLTPRGAVLGPGGAPLLYKAPNLVRLTSISQTR